MTMHDKEKTPVRAALGLAVCVLFGLGLLYPLAGVALGQIMFPLQANGSLIQHGDRVVGSSLLAQSFSSAAYFHPRPSAADYVALAASGSNLARSNPVLQAQVQQRRIEVAGREGVAPAHVPADLLTASGSGLDPDISPQGAAIQVARVAQARGLAPAAVAALLQSHVQPRQFGLLGQARVNVLQLNLALDDAWPGVRP